MLGILSKLLENFDVAVLVRFLPKTHTVDAVMTQKNLEPVPEPPFPFQMIGLRMDFETQWRTMETILGIVDGDRGGVLCNHDPDLFAKPVYP